MLRVQSGCKNGDGQLLCKAFIFDLLGKDVPVITEKETYLVTFLKPFDRISGDSI